MSGNARKPDGGTGRGRVVYSVGPGGVQGGGSGGAEPAVVARPPSSQNVRVRFERAGRGGKTVTVIAPVELAREDAQSLLTRLKKLCGSGGTLKPGATPAGVPCFELEVQGDHVDRIVAALVAEGFRAKRG